MADVVEIEGPICRAMRHSNRVVMISSQLRASIQAHGGDHRGQVASDRGNGTAGDEGTA